MEKLNSFKVVAIATGVSGNVYEVSSELILDDMPDSLARIQNQVLSSTLNLMKEIDGLREIVQPHDGAEGG